MCLSICATCNVSFPPRIKKIDFESTAFLGTPRKAVDLGHMFQHSLSYNFFANKVTVKPNVDIFNIWMVVVSLSEKVKLKERHTVFVLIAHHANAKKILDQAALLWNLVINVLN